MANLDAPNGFTPIRHLTGGTIRLEEIGIVSGEAAAIYSGDLVMQIAGGTIKVGTATAAGVAIGVFAGCKYTKTTGEIVYSKYWPAAQTTLGSADAVAYVYTDPQIVFAGQTAGTALFADNGALLDLTATAGSATTGRSAQEINQAASSVDQFRQIGLVNKPGNAWGANAEIEVLIHLHVRNPGAGVAI